MRTHLVAAATFAALVVVTAPANAQEYTGHRTISAGDYVRAERLLSAERRRDPSRPELMLNLAAVYLKTGRPAEARALYAEVLDRPELMMDMPSGRTRSSHAIADGVISSLDRGVAVAAR